MRPDFVMTVGDFIQGYEDRESWLQQKDSFLEATNKLTMPWYPAAGNHDIYWVRNTEGRPNDHHESDYEANFGPLWYAFEYQNSWFIVLFTDEGNPGTAEKATNTPELQTMSDAQFTWLNDTLEKARDADHVFMFMHHPRWRGGSYGDDWNKVHRALVEAGNVSAVFAGHTHSPAYQQTDGIDYYTLGTTGGSKSADAQHLFYWLSVRQDDYDIIGIPLNSIIDPRAKE
jgi:3',5'-cyclic AMP phosphodiesterase CpdA